MYSDIFSLVAGIDLFFLTIVEFHNLQCLGTFELCFFFLGEIAYDTVDGSFGFGYLWKPYEKFEHILNINWWSPDFWTIKCMTCFFFWGFQPS